MGLAFGKPTLPSRNDAQTTMQAYPDNLAIHICTLICELAPVGTDTHALKSKNPSCIVATPILIDQ